MKLCMILQIRYLVPGSISLPQAVASGMIMTVTVYIDMTLHMFIHSVIGKAIRGYWLCLFMYILQMH